MPPEQDSGAMEPAMHKVVFNAVEPQHKRDVIAIVGQVEPQVLQRRAPLQDGRAKPAGANPDTCDRISIRKRAEAGGHS